MAIKYTEKGIGLHDAIAAAGLSLWQEGGEWRTGPGQEAAVQAIIDGYTLGQAIANRQAECLVIAKGMRDKAINGISSGEMAGWPIKLAEARAFAADPAGAPTPMLSAEAAARGVTVAELVGKVGGNSARFAALEAAIGGTDGRHRDALAKLATFEDVAAYDLTAGWPKV
jgi:hypothetical protein